MYGPVQTVAQVPHQPPAPPPPTLSAFDRALSEDCYDLTIEIIEALGWSITFTETNALGHWEATIATNTSVVSDRSSSKTEAALRALKAGVEVEVAQDF